IVSTRASWATPHGGMRRRFNDRLGDAQDTRDTAVSFGSFSFPGKKMNKPIKKTMPRIGRTSPHPPPEAEGLDQNEWLIRPRLNHQE
ncbi:MAG: hypothetical protein QNJ61_18980, partial [Desulfobacterales bacterium]|nr:hypothetical protein [Desulfobacterales bacterium]